MLNLGILGIGNAGNQICNDATLEGIDVFCINTSEKDLDTINTDIPVFLLGDSEGAGKDRTLAKNYVKKHYKSLLKCEYFDSFIAKKDAVFIASSSGGGTGSGVSIILTDILSKVYPNKIFINIGILPTITESIGAQRNTLEFLKELRAMNKGYMLYDNNNYKSLSPAEYMKKVNREIIESLLYIRGDYSTRTSFGMIDDADSYKILSVPGMINITRYENFFEKDMENGVPLDTYIIKEMKNNATCICDKDRIVKRIGIWLNLSKDLTKYYDASIASLKESVGEPFEIFEHYYVFAEKDTPVNRFAVIMSGLSLPDDRINMIIQRIQEVEEALHKKKETSLIDKVESLEIFKVQGLHVDRTKTEEKEEVDNIDFDFLDNY